MFGFLLYWWFFSIILVWFEKLKNKRAWKFISFIMTVVALLVVYFGGFFQYKDFSVLLLVFTPIVLFFSAGKLNFSARFKELLEVAGNMTYSSYLIHFPIQLIIVLCFVYLNKQIPYHSNLFFIAFIGATLFLSYFVYKFFELPLQRFIRKKLM